MTHVGVSMRRLLMVLLAATLLFGITATVATQTADAAYPGGTGWIVFENNFDLYVVPAEGGATVEASSDPYPQADPVFSPDGTQVAFAADYPGFGSAIFVADFNSGNGTLGLRGDWTPVSSGPVDGEPTWSPDGSKIAYLRRIVSAVGSGGANTVEDLTGVTLTHDPGGSFQTDGVAVGDIVTNEATGEKGTVTSVTSETVLVMAGGLVGTDGEWEVGNAYSIEHRSHRQLYYSDSDGTDLAGTALSAGGWDDSYDDQNPAWSPDGDYIAFETTRNNNADIYTLEFANPNTVVNLTPAPVDLFATRPSWSPDSAQIAFQSKHLDPGEDEENIWRVGATGGGLVQVTNSAGDDLAPAWSPDGTEIAFRNAVNTGLYAAPADSVAPGTPRLIAADAGGNTNNEPDWQPVLTGVDDTESVDEGGPSVNIDVLANDLVLVDDVGTASTSPTLVDPPDLGTATRQTDGTFTYEHDGAEIGTAPVQDTFEYTVTQGSFTSTAVVTVTINPVDNVPVAVDDEATVANGGSKDIDVLSNDTDPEGGVLTVVLGPPPANGTATVNPDGTVAYTHDGSNTLTDSFTYQAKDAGANASNTATVTITVGALNPDPPSPSISGPSFGQAGEEVTFTSTITDGSGGPVTYVWTVTRAGATVDTGTSITLDFTPTLSGVFDVELAATDSAGTGTTSFKFTVMTDIGDSVFVSDIVWLANEGITKGCNPPVNDQFCPDSTVTRGQMAAFLVRFLGLTETDPTIAFTDTASSIFEDDILKLATAGITRGCNADATEYCPNDSVTRGQMAAFLVRALSLTDDGGGDLFEDDDDSIFEGDIDRLATAGITRGCNPPANTNFCPTDTVTRGQMAAFLHRADGLT